MTKPGLRAILPFFVFVFGCQGAPDLTGTGEPNISRAPWDDFRDQFIEGYFEYNPRAGVNAGRHEYDGQLRDIRPESVAETITWLNEQRSASREYSVDDLPGRAAFEREYLVAAIDQELFALDVSGFLEKNPVTSWRCRRGRRQWGVVLSGRPRAVCPRSGEGAKHA